MAMASGCAFIFGRPVHCHASCQSRIAHPLAILAPPTQRYMVIVTPVTGTSQFRMMHIEGIVNLVRLERNRACGSRLRNYPEIVKYFRYRKVGGVF